MLELCRQRAGVRIGLGPRLCGCEPLAGGVEVPRQRVLGGALAIEWRTSQLAGRGVVGELRQTQRGFDGPVVMDLLVVPVTKDHDFERQGVIVMVPLEAGLSAASRRLAFVLRRNEPGSEGNCCRIARRDPFGMPCFVARDCGSVPSATLRCLRAISAACPLAVEVF